MLDETEQKGFIEALCIYLAKYKAERELRIVQIAEMNISELENYQGDGYFNIILRISPIEFVEYVDDIELIQSNITNASRLLLKDMYSIPFFQAIVCPKFSGPIQKKSISKENKDKLIISINEIKAILISVSTGGERIQHKNDEYLVLRENIEKLFLDLGITEVGLFKDLWDWYGVWSSGAYKTYQSRRIYISTLIDEVISKIPNIESGKLAEVELTGSQRLDRTIREIRFRYSQADNEEKYQAIGVLCRESLITLAQMAYNPEKHLKYCDIAPSSTDTKRMLDAFFQGELPGSTYETLRKYAKAANDLANELTHRRTANKKDTAICVNATFSVVNIVYSIIEKVDSTSI